jgi:hypothetical protein
VGHAITAKAKAPLITAQALRRTLTGIRSIDAESIVLSPDVQRSSGSFRRSGDAGAQIAKTPTTHH